MNSNPPPANETTTNTASFGATVGIQANNVHDVTIYQISPHATAADKYRVGYRYLQDGVPNRAKDLIGTALAEGYDNPEARFHWILSMFSGRSYRDLNKAERHSLQLFASQYHDYPHDEYTSALTALTEMLRHLKSGDTAPVIAEEGIPKLRPDLRALIDRHLGLVLSGATRDKLWQDTREKAQAEQYSRGRNSRLWAYFHPKPIPARAKKPHYPAVGEFDHIRAGAATVLFALAALYLGWLIVTAVSVAAMPSYVASVTAGYYGLRLAFRWRHSSRRFRQEEAAYQTGRIAPKGNGFAKSVYNSFERYFAKYRPAETEIGDWLRITEAARGRLRSEISEIYRQQETTVGRLNWLIGYLARDVNQRWQDRTLYDYQQRHYVPIRTQVGCVLLLAVMFVTAATVVVTAIFAAPAPGALAAVTALLSGRYAAFRWEHIQSEKRRYQEQCVDHQEELGRREAEYKRWRAKLEATRPSEADMETWLWCDKILFIDNALRHYRLSWSGIISHTLVQGPAGGERKRARAKGGPWRFSHYHFTLFVITEDGVREVSSKLNFLKGSFGKQDRENYRFDAVSSVRVAEWTDSRRTLYLTLSNGPRRKLNITDGDVPTSATDMSELDLLDINLSHSGYAHALHILEGIAAEGKAWFDHDPLLADGEPLASRS